jgi:hypothetical protein
MEEVLQLYTSPFDPDYPLVCFDESSKQLISETREPLPPQPGQPERFDYEYQREGVCNLFMFFEPLTGDQRSWHCVIAMSRLLTSARVLTTPN